MHFWLPYYIKDVIKLDRVQKRFTRMVPRMETLFSHRGWGSIWNKLLEKLVKASTITAFKTQLDTSMVRKEREVTMAQIQENGICVNNHLD